MEFEKMADLPQPDFEDQDIPLVKLAIHSRRNMVNKLRLRGYTNREMATKIGCSLSIIEKDLHEIREKSRNWFDSESIKDFCQSLQDSIILCDNVIEDLQLLYSEGMDLDSKFKIISKITEFEDRKTSLYEKTHSVQNFLSIEK